MGLVDKLITSFLDCVWQNILLLPPEDDLAWTRLRDAGAQLATSIALLRHVKFVCSESKTPENEAEVKRVQAEKTRVWQTQKKDVIR